MKRYLLNGDILDYLKSNGTSQAVDIYSGILKKRRHRSYLTKNILFASLLQLRRSGIIVYENGIATLNDRFCNLPVKDILVMMMPTRSSEAEVKS